MRADRQPDRAGRGAGPYASHPCANSSAALSLAGVEIYCDACGEFGHTWVTTDENGVYDFGRDGIWSDGGGVTAIVINKDGYNVAGGSHGPSGWTSLYVRINGDTRFDFQMFRRE